MNKERLCLRCGHNWKTRLKDSDPLQCPICHSPKWAEKRNKHKGGSAMYNKKGIADLIVLVLIILVVIGIGWYLVYKGQIKQNNVPKVNITTTTTQIIEYLPLNKTCKADSNCTDYLDRLHIKADVSCRNNLCMQKVVT